MERYKKMKPALFALLLAASSFGQAPLTFLKMITANQNGAHLPDMVDVMCMSADNRHIYCCANDSIVIFARDTATGLLSCLTWMKPYKFYDMQSIVVSPDDKNVYLTCWTIKNKTALLIFNRDNASGSLSFGDSIVAGQGGGADSLGGASAVIVNPDNRNVYVLSGQNILIFKRDILTGALVFRSMLGRTNGIEGLTTQDGIAISPDNKNAYVVGRIDRSLVVFARDTETGDLTFMKCFKNNQDRTDLGIFPRKVMVSPDNKNIYMVGDRILSVYIRDPANGGLSYYNSFFGTENVIEKFNDIGDIAVSPDNNKVFVTSIFENALHVFNRDISTGALTHRACLRVDNRLSDTLNDARIVIVSSDNKNVYVGCQGIAVFGMNTSSIHSQAEKTFSKLDKDFAITREGRLYTIAFVSKISGDLLLSLFDAEGKLVKRVFSSRAKAGGNAITVDFSDVRSGMYFLSLLNTRESKTVKMSIAR
jgi:DNA-binding beta-propeller fold protein YncE